MNKNIAIIGIGGVGGYIAGMLGTAYPHISLVARGNRRKAIMENGLSLHSDTHGEITIHPEKLVEIPRELEPQDYIFICVKNYSLEEICKDMVSCITGHTVIVPVMNGVDPGNRIRNFLKKGIVIDSLIYIIAYANPDYSITQQGIRPTIRVGVKNADKATNRMAAEVADLLKGASIDCQASNDIEHEIWKKYIFNCAYNVATAYYDCSIGKLRNDPSKSHEFEMLLYEAYQVAKAKGIPMGQEHINAMIDRFYHVLDGDATSSLKRDIHAGHSSELETFSGYLLTEARKLDINLPVSEKMYQTLKNR